MAIIKQKFFLLEWITKRIRSEFNSIAFIIMF